MHEELNDPYLKIYERMASFDRERKGREKRERQRRIYRRISLSGASLVFTLLIVSLVHYFASQRGVSKRSGGPSPPETARLDHSRTPAGINNPDEVINVHLPSKPNSKTPVGRTVVVIYLPQIVPSPKTPVGLTKQVEVPALPDLDSVSFPDRYPLNGNVTDLPSAPPMDPTHAMIAGASSGATSADANAVIAALEKYSDAWNTKRVAQITALRPGLPRRTVVQELSSASSIIMRIQPTSIPRIQGNRATVECIHQVDQVFTDGVEKQNLGVKMIYVLVRRGSNWLIEESR
jgi:hypothetical protein